MKNLIPLPYFASTKVVRGFGRGSKALGTPTANFEQQVIDNLPDTLPTGIYFGWAKVDQLGPKVYKMVTCVGWNPFFNNERKSMETHIMHKFPEDFYGSSMKICLVGYIRDEKNFKSLDELKEAINGDIDAAEKELDKPEYLSLVQNNYFTGNDVNGFSKPNIRVS